MDPPTAQDRPRVEAVSELEPTRSADRFVRIAIASAGCTIAAVLATFLAAQLRLWLVSPDDWALGDPLLLGFMGAAAVPIGLIGALFAVPLLWPSRLRDSVPRVTIAAVCGSAVGNLALPVFGTLLGLLAGVGAMVWCRGKYRIRAG